MCLDRLQDLFRMDAVIRDRHRRDYRILPGIEMIDFRYRYIEALTQPVFQAFHYMPFLFERVRTFDVNLKR